MQYNCFNLISCTWGDLPQFFQGGACVPEVCTPTPLSLHVFLAPWFELRQTHGIQ